MGYGLSRFLLSIRRRIRKSGADHQCGGRKVAGLERRPLLYSASPIAGFFLERQKVAHGGIGQWTGRDACFRKPKEQVPVDHFRVWPDLHWLRRSDSVQHSLLSVDQVPLDALLLIRDQGVVQLKSLRSCRRYRHGLQSLMVTRRTTGLGQPLTRAFLQELKSAFDSLPF